MNNLSYIGKFVDVLFFPLNSLNPIISILILTLIFTLITLFFRKKFLGNEEIKNLRKEMDEIRERILKNREKEEELFNRLMKLNATIFKQTFKILVVSLVIGILCLSWIQYNYSGNYVKLPISFPFQNIQIIYFYIILTFIISTVLTKLLEVS